MISAYIFVIRPSFGTVFISQISSYNYSIAPIPSTILLKLLSSRNFLVLNCLFISHSQKRAWNSSIIFDQFESWCMISPFVDTIVSPSQSFCQLSIHIRLGSSDCTSAYWSYYFLPPPFGIYSPYLPKIVDSKAWDFLVWKRCHPIYQLRFYSAVK